MALGAFEKLRDALAGGGVQFKFAIAAGAAANTNIAVAGLRADAELIAVIQFAAGTPSDVGAVASITSAGNIQLTSVSTGDQLLVVYAQRAK